jgi:hypothetical protein
MNNGKSSFLYRNSLSIVLLALMLIFWAGQLLTGWTEHNEERKEDGLTAQSLADYTSSGHFISATFENWESEFLQMAIYVLLTVSLRQKGSAESRKLPEEGEESDEPTPLAQAPCPVRKGGIWLKLYEHSLSIALVLLFLISFCLHFIGSQKQYNEDQLLAGKQPVPAAEYILHPNFWFESFQNWQSEFLAVAAIVLLSIWLREKDSPESKPVDAPHGRTGG